mmetsp:Transcript_23107/g.56966  ORF Transcript_23107/g.56966 Transcript_23107/m.56966 type:complete len:101 (-) Transcript_23107:494-796(-)|eukprot:CAMPEP_0206253388 /NCGR_PEP_ID=MMETSP0047_2-20121206/23124_1 /ASSEMBLY_ACC=CAM_ASM_000192 /TAXON_ID=195065 /ORGANISM="Chroomonas mesostigmatica_cf, Strain CCMP1168" /LENGTH=100 /DNA_ID=CAMNT_0053679591 /DNA_START=82 /DNA_END=384 /DNA_ORIENTATION=-
MSSLAKTSKGAAFVLAGGLSLIGGAAYGASMREQKIRTQASNVSLQSALQSEAEGLLVTAPGQFSTVSPSELSLTVKEASQLKTRTSGQYYGRFTGEYRA